MSPHSPRAIAALLVGLAACTSAAATETSTDGSSAVSVSAQSGTATTGTSFAGTWTLDTAKSDKPPRPPQGGMGGGQGGPPQGGMGGGQGGPPNGGMGGPAGLPTLVIAQTANGVILTRGPRADTLVTDGTTRTTTTPDGRSVKVTATLSGSTLTISRVDDRATRAETLTLSADGKVLTAVNSVQPTGQSAMTFTLVFNRTS